MQVSFRIVLAALLLTASHGFAADLLIGNVATTTNVQAVQNSTNIMLGYTIYFQEINGQGGVRGRQLKLVNKDDGLVADKMVELARELIADPNVIALAGFLNTPGLVEIMKRNVLVEGKIAMVAPIGPFNAANFYPVRPGYNDEAEKLLSEAQETQKKRVALVYYNQAFAPGVFKYSEESAKREGVNVVATAMFEADPAKIEAGILATIDKLAKIEADAVILIAAGTGAYSFVKHFRSTAGRDVQVYVLSPVDSFGLVKAAGVENARGVVI